MGASASVRSPALARYNALRDEGVEPEEASRRVASEFPNLEELHPELKGTVTAGPVQTVGTPASEVARLKSTGPLAGRIEASLKALPEETARPGLGKVTSREIEKQHPWSLGRGVAEMALTGAVENAAPMSGEAVEESDLERLAQSGVDVSKHANLLAAANVAGLLGGGAPLVVGGKVAKLPKALTAGARLARIAGASGRGAAATGTLAAEGAMLEQQDPKTAAKNIALQTAMGAALGGAMAPEARQVAGEVASLAGRGMASSSTRPGGRPLTGSVRTGSVAPTGERVGAFGDIQRQGPFTSAHALEMGKVRAAETAPKEAPDLLPAMERERASSPVVYHGTPKSFDKIKAGEDGIFFTDNAQVAEGYKANRGLWLSPPKEGSVKRATLDLKRPLEIDAMGARNNNVPVPWAEHKKTVYGNLPKDAWSVRRITQYAKEQGYDGVVIRNVMDAAEPTNKAKSTVYAVFSPEQVRLLPEPEAAPTLGRRVGAIGDVNRFPDPKPARAAGTPVENVPTMDTQRPRMFKEKDFELSPEGRAEFDAIMGPVGVQSRVTWKEAEELAKTIGTDPQKILRNARDLSGEEILALKQGVSQNIERMVALRKIVEDPNTPRAEQLAALGEIDRRMTDVSTMGARATMETSQKARDLNLSKVMGLNTMDPGVWSIFATKMKGLPLTAEETLAIAKAAGERDREELSRIVANMKTLSPWEKLVTGWTAGLLYNPKTHLINIGGNSVAAIMEQGKDAPAAIVDMMLSLGTGRRTKAFPALSSVASAARQVAGPGYQGAKMVLRSGMTPADLQKWDFRNGRFGKTLGSKTAGRVLDLYTQIPFRALSAADQLFKAAAIGRSLDEQIRVEAGNIFRAQKKKLGPKQTYAEIVKYLRENIPDSMQAEAIADGDFATFNSENALASAIQSGKMTLKKVGGEPAWAAAESQVRFVRTPTNVLARTLDYTPAGILRAFRPAVKMLQGHDLDANQKKVAEAFGRASTGSLLLWLGFETMRKGLATGTMPRGSKDEWDVRGRQAGSVKIGDNWHQVVRMAPGGTLFTLGAQMARIYENVDSPSDMIGGSAAALAKVVADQPFLQGVGRINDALNESEEDAGKKAGTWLRSNVASAVPAIVSAAARGTDPYQRETGTVANAVKARIPGLSRSVPAKLDVFGRPLPQTGGVARQMFDVTNTSKDRETPVLKEARRLGVSLTRPSKTITVAGKTYTLSPQEYRAVQMQVGPDVLRRLEAALNLPGYLKERATPERTDLAQRERLEAAIRDAKAKSRAELSRQIYRAEKEGAEHVGTLRPKRPKF